MAKIRVPELFSQHPSRPECQKGDLVAFGLEEAGEKDTLTLRPATTEVVLDNQDAQSFQRNGPRTAIP